MPSATAPVAKPVIKTPAKPAPAPAEAKDTAPSSAPPPQTETGRPKQEAAEKPDATPAQVAAVQAKIAAITDVPPSLDGLTAGMLDQLADPTKTLGVGATVADAILVNSEVAADAQNRPAAEAATAAQPPVESQAPPVAPETVGAARQTTSEPAATAPAASRKEPEPKSQSHWTERWGLTGLTENDRQMLDRLLGSAVSVFYHRKDIFGLLSTAVMRSPSGLAVMESVAAYMRSAGASVPQELDGFLARPEVQTSVSEHQDRLRNAARGGLLTDAEAAELAQTEHRADLFTTLQSRMEAAIKKKDTMAVQNFLKSPYLLGQNFEFNVGGILLSAGALPSDPTEQQRALADFSKKWDKMVPATIKERLGQGLGKAINALIALLLMLQSVQMVDQVVAQSAEPPRH